jgi:hypothetical protein
VKQLAGLNRISTRGQLRGSDGQIPSGALISSATARLVAIDRCRRFGRNAALRRVFNLATPTLPH